MKLELSLTWNPHRPAWRVVSRYFHWGPWCYSRTDAWRSWFQSMGWKHELYHLAWPIIRLWRWLHERCIVCGVQTYSPKFGAYRYCSLECAAYDQALKDPRRSWVLFGTVKTPKPHFEADMKGGE